MAAAKPPFERGEPAAQIAAGGAQGDGADVGRSAVVVNVTLPGAVPLAEWRGRTVEGEARRDDEGGDDDAQK